MSDHILRAILGVIAGGIIFIPLGIFLFRDFQFRPRANDPRQVNSFFDLNEFVLSENLRTFAKLYAAAVCGILWIAFILLSTFEKPGKLVSTIIEKLFKESQNTTLSAISDLVKDSDVGTPLSLFLLCIASIIGFLPYLSRASALLKSSVQNGIDFDDTCARLVAVSANDVKEVGAEGRFLPAPALPREYGTASEPDRALRFVLLNKAIEYAPSVGLIPALRKVLGDQQVESCLQDPPGPVPFRLVIFLCGFYFVLAFIYCVLIVEVGKSMCKPTGCDTILGSFSLPGATSNELSVAFYDVAINCFLFSAQVALPFWIGIALYNRKIMSSSGEFSFRENFGPVAGMQMTWSVFLGVFSIGLIYAYCWASGTPVPLIWLPGASVALVSPWGVLQFFISVTLAPVVTVLWVWLSEKYSSQIVRALITAIFGSLLYGFMGFCYSCLAAMWDTKAAQNDVEWGVQAFYIILACGILWSVTGVKLSEPTR